MRLHRFYIPQSVESETIDTSDKELVHQWKNVFRYTVGAQVIVFNGDGYDYLCLVSQMRNSGATLHIVSRKKAVMPARKIGLGMALIKKDTMELVIQKATELGVSEIFPIIAERSEKKSLNMERAVKIAIEASEQSGRGDVPTIHEPLTLEEFLQNTEVQSFGQKIIFTPKAERFDVSLVQNTSIMFAIGPEGGFSDTEVALFLQYNFIAQSLGDLILRAETAVISALSLLLLK